MEARAGSEAGGPAVAGRTGRTGDGVAGPRNWDRIAGIAGLIFIVLLLASFFTPETPAADTPADRMAATIIADASGHELSLFLAFLSDILFLVFLAGLWSRLRRWEGVGGMFAGLFVIGGAVFYSTILVSEGLYLALVKAATSADPSVLLPLAQLDNWVGAGTLPAAVAMLVGATGAILTTRALPSWLGWLGAVTALLLLVSVAGVFEDDVDDGVLGFVGFGGFLLFMVWVLATSIMLLLKAGGAGPYDEPGQMRASGRLAA
jgi:hypothetical protein